MNIPSLGLLGVVTSCLIALFVMPGCQGAWQDNLMSKASHETGGDATPHPADVELEPEPKILPDTYMAAGRLAEGRGELILAVSMYRKAAALNHDCVSAYNRLGLLLARLGHHKRADEALTTAIELAPDKAYLRNNLAYSYILQHRWKEAEGELRQALDVQPEFTRARVNLGMVLARLGQYEQAMKHFLLVLPPASAHYNLGLICEFNRGYAKARESFTQALALDPQMQAARDGLARVSVHAPGPDLNGDGVARANRGLLVNQAIETALAEQAVAEKAEPLPVQSEPELPRELPAPKPEPKLPEPAPEPEASEQTPAKPVNPLGPLSEACSYDTTLTAVASIPGLIDPAPQVQSPLLPPDEAVETGANDEPEGPAYPVALRLAPILNDESAAAGRFLVDVAGELAAWVTSRADRAWHQLRSQSLSALQTDRRSASASVEAPPLILPDSVSQHTPETSDMPKRVSRARFSGFDRSTGER